MPVGSHRAAVHVVRPASRSRCAGRKKATAPPVRVACVGNSITYGTGIQDRARDSYPAQLQRMLGSGYVRRGLYINVSRMGNSLVVRFDYADGLSTADGKAPSTFEIAEEEGLYHPATAVIAGCTVVLTSPEVKHPRLVRYGWQPFTRANLVNGASLPASTFRGEVGAHD